MTGSDRAGFLRRVAAAVRTGNRFRPERQELPLEVGYLGSGSDLCGRFIAESTAVGVHVQRIRTRDEAREAARAVLARHAVARALLGCGDLLEELAMDELLQSAGVEVLSLQELRSAEEPIRRDRIFAADMGITQPDWAIAETGTLVYVSGPEQTRSATLLPPVHLAVVDTRTLLADLFDLTGGSPDAAQSLGRAGNVALVTGPSKTGDIELKLTTGVHGPGEVHVLVWDRSA